LLSFGVSGDIVKRTGSIVDVPVGKASLCPLFWFCPFLLLFSFLIVNKDHEKYSNEGPQGI
jgi:hypothetical protein